MKDIADTFFVDPANATKVNVDNLKENYQVAAKDIVFRSRGYTNTCSVVTSISAATVIAAPLFQIRAKTPEAMPEYLCWLLNQSPAQNYFNKNARGTSVRMIGRDTLENLPVDIPPLEIQQQITAIAKLADREQRLMVKLAERKKTLISEILMRVASEVGKGAEKERLPEVISAPREDMDIHPQP